MCPKFADNAQAMHLQKAVGGGSPMCMIALRLPPSQRFLHRGVETRCMPGWPLAVLGYCYAAAAVAALAAAALADAWQRRERRATYELAPRDDDWPLPEA